MSGATGKRASPESDAGATGVEEAIDWSAVKSRRSAVVDCKRSSYFIDYIRNKRDQMGEDSFAEWLGFGVEDPEGDVRDFEEWYERVRPGGGQRFQGSETNASTDVAVDIESCVVPMEGKTNMKALLTVPGTTEANASGKSDLYVLLDGSGSMNSAVGMLRDSLIKMAEDAKTKYDKGESPVTHDFAFGTFGSNSYAPGLVPGSGDSPTGYTPWMPLHEMRAAMRNVAATINANLGSTNLENAIGLAIDCLKKRREDEDLPNHYVQHLLIMTDGVPDHGQKFTVPTALTREIGDLSIIVHVLCLGDHTDIELSEQMAETTRGIMGFANRPETLKDAFESILEPLRTSSRAFTIEIRDKGDTKRVLHYGLLTPSNNSALTTLSFGPKTQSGAHIAATVKLQGSAFPTVVVPDYRTPEDEMWNSKRAKCPKALKDALDAQDLIVEHKAKVLAKAEESTLREALELSSQLTAQYSATGIGAVALRRVNAFHGDLDAQVAAQAHAEQAHGSMPSSMLSRTTTLSAVMSRGSYSQAF